MDAMPMLRFDASIDLTDAIVPAGMSPEEAMARVQRAVEAMPGASWIGVDYAGLAPSSLVWLTLYEPGCSQPRRDGAWNGQTGVVIAVARQALGQ